jgi:hypothetical protein
MQETGNRIQETGDRIQETEYRTLYPVFCIFCIYPALIFCMLSPVSCILSPVFSFRLTRQYLHYFNPFVADALFCFYGFF